MRGARCRGAFRWLPSFPTTYREWSDDMPGKTPEGGLHRQGGYGGGPGTRAVASGVHFAGGETVSGPIPGVEHIEGLVVDVIRGNRRALARLLTVFEDGGPGADAAADSLHRLAGIGGDVERSVGVTGPPGAGKSTLIDRLIGEGRQRALRMAVLAIDPSSPFSGGAILGDRVRLAKERAGDDGVFVRSMAARGALGGLADAVPNAVRAMGVGGWDWVMIETVGVGQSEVEVATQAGTVVVVVTPESGDEIQANKAGLVETGDVFVVNKADRPGSDVAARNLRNMIRLGSSQAWTPPVVRVSAVDGVGVDGLWQAIEEHQQYLQATGEDAVRRGRRLRNELRRRLLREFEVLADMAVRTGAAAEVLAAVEQGHVLPAAGARKLMEVVVGAEPSGWRPDFSRASVQTG